MSFVLRCGYRERRNCCTNLKTNGYWVGATNFAEAPKDAKWNIRFTESAMNITTEIDIDKNYALYTSSLYPSPTGLTEIGTDVVVYATRVEDILL